MAEGHSPLHQFEIKKLFELPELFGYDISYTNSSLFMSLVVAFFMFIFVMGSKKALVPGRMQSLGEWLYEFTASVLKDNAGAGAKKYLPFVLTLFLFVIGCNLMGMVPFSFTVTSHIAVTFAMAAFIFIGVTVIGFIKHGTHFSAMFIPQGVHWSVAAFMFPIELFSYLARPVSLSVRLAANMMAGHTMIKVIAGFVVMMGAYGVLPLAFMVILVGFEIFVAVLQAYIFTVLTCVYLNDALNMH